VSLTHDEQLSEWFSDAIDYAESAGIPLVRLRELIVEMTTPCPPFEVFDDAGSKLAEFQTETEVRDALIVLGYYAVDAVGNTLQSHPNGTSDDNIGWQIKGDDFT
jgi:hypothetical protein